MERSDVQHTIRNTHIKFNRLVAILQNSLACLFEVSGIMTGQGMSSSCRALTVPQDKQGYLSAKPQLFWKWNVGG